MVFKENLNKKLYLEKSGKHGAKKQELFNCLLFHFSHVSYVSHLVTFFRILKTQFSIFSNAFSKRIFRFFQKTVKKCEKGAFWRCTWKKCEKCVLKMHLEKMWKIVEKWEKRTFEIQLGRWNSDFFLQVWSFWAQFCCSYFAACPTSAGWKSERIDRKWTVQIADLFNFSIAKQWLPGART